VRGTADGSHQIFRRRAGGESGIEPRLLAFDAIEALLVGLSDFGEGFSDADDSTDLALSLFEPLFELAVISDVHLRRELYGLADGFESFFDCFHGRELPLLNYRTCGQ
jgi:hypothetical protein